jgi:hypothetical protein
VINFQRKLADYMGTMRLNCWSGATAEVNAANGWENIG